MRVRVSLTGEDVRLVVNSRDTVAQVLLCLSERQFKILKVSNLTLIKIYVNVSSFVSVV